MFRRTESGIHEERLTAYGDKLMKEEDSPMFRQSKFSTCKLFTLSCESVKQVFFSAILLEVALEGVTYA